MFKFLISYTYFVNGGVYYSMREFSAGGRKLNMREVKMILKLIADLHALTNTSSIVFLNVTELDA